MAGIIRLITAYKLHMWSARFLLIHITASFISHLKANVSIKGIYVFSSNLKSRFHEVSCYTLYTYPSLMQMSNTTYMAAAPVVGITD